jgi:ElaB/YqjD/DUF883 family membrane-anchored ribosome-binding protein
MKTDILSTIIEVERNIHERIEAEKKKSRDRVEQIKAETARLTAQEADRLRGNSEKAVAKAKADAQVKAAEQLRQAALRSEQFVHVGDELVKKIVARYIVKILPEGYEHDHYNVES